MGREGDEKKEERGGREGRFLLLDRWLAQVPGQGPKRKRFHREQRAFEKQRQSYMLSLGLLERGSSQIATSTHKNAEVMAANTNVSIPIR